MTPTPPDFLIRILETTLPPGIAGRSMVGDLLEEWHARKPGARRTAWFVSAALTLAGRYAAIRVGAWTAAFVRSAGRTLERTLRHPLPTAITVLVLGVGIAAPATMYSIVSGLTGELELEESDRLLHVGRRWSPDVVGIAPLDWLWPGLDRMDDLVESAGVYVREEADLSGGPETATRIETTWASPGVLAAFRVEPLLGRAFDRADATGESAPVILGHELWRSRFGGDRAVLGGTIRLNGVPRTVVGVMPPGFAHPGGSEAWMPLDPDSVSDPERRAYQGAVRLAEGATLENVTSRVDALTTTLREVGEEIEPGGGVAVERWRYSLISSRDRRMLTVLVLVVGFVLVIACANIVNLLLARALSRSRETAVRVALGASRSRIVGAHLAEAAVLSGLAGFLGLGLTVWGVRMFRERTAGQLAYWMEVSVDPSVLVFGAGLIAAAAIGTGVVPALQASRIDVQPTLRDAGRTASAFRIGRAGRILVTGEIALSCVLLVVAGLWVRAAMTSLDPEGDLATASVLTARYELRADAYSAEGARAFHRRLLEELRSHPGVADAALSSHLPGLYVPPIPVEPVQVEGSTPGRPEDRPRTHFVRVSPSFFSTLESGLLRGRAPTRQDGFEGRRAVVVNRAFAREHLEGRDPLGSRLRLGSREFDEGGERPWATVVGVVPDLGVAPDGNLNGVTVYAPLSPEPIRPTAVLARAAPGADPRAVAPDLRRLVSELDPDVAVWDMETLAGQIADRRSVREIFARLFLAFGLAGLLLAAVGLYGLLAFTVRRRVRELGVRIALGATPFRVLRTAVGGGLVQVGSGLAAGLALAAVVAPLVAGSLEDVNPGDPLIYGAVAGALAVTAIAASVAPARRALGVDVMEAVRTE